MKEIVLKPYEFDELSKDSRERIIERERWNVMERCMDAYDIDYKKSMEAFEDLTDTKVYGWEVGYGKWRRTMGKEVKIDAGYKDVLEKSLSAIQYLRIHGFSTYMESEGIVNRIMMFKDKNEMRDQKTRSI